uniref:Uncharacterized protein n=1 Tax=Megaselia scalaris TaxID=36166 RepID=T1GPI5_MEGSC
MATEAIKTKAQQEEIIAEFQNMRNEQRMLATKLNTLEMDLKEHNCDRIIENSRRKQEMFPFDWWSAL